MMPKQWKCTEKDKMGNQMMKVDPELINGKPYFGFRFSSYCTIIGYLGPKEEDPVYCMAKEKVETYIKNLDNFNLGVRHIEMFEQLPYYTDPLAYIGYMGVSYVLWGRAFKVMRLQKKGIRRYQKKRIGGRLRRVRIDK